MQTIETHKLLLDREVTLANIHEARIARTKSLEDYERNEKIRESQGFEACKLSLAPNLYDRELERMKIESCKDTCAWLVEDEDFRSWFNSGKRSSAFLWLSGIPGAGQYCDHFFHSPSSKPLPSSIPMPSITTLRPLLSFPSCVTFKLINTQHHHFIVVRLMDLALRLLIRAHRQISPGCQFRFANEVRKEKRTLRFLELSTPGVNKSS